MRNYFTDKDQACKCCGKGRLHPDSLMRFNRARHRADIPFNVNCGSRCRAHNTEVGGTEDSAHLIDDYGFSKALDIRCSNSRDRSVILRSLIAEGFTRIGVYKTFIHADDDPSLPQEVTWVS